MPSRRRSSRRKPRTAEKRCCGCRIPIRSRASTTAAPVDQKPPGLFGATGREAGRALRQSLSTSISSRRYNDFYGHQEGGSLPRSRCQCAEGVDRSPTMGRSAVWRRGIHRAGTAEDAGAGGGSGGSRTAQRRDPRSAARTARDGMSIVTVSVGAGFTRNQIGSKLERLIHERIALSTGQRRTAATVRASSIRTTRKAATRARTSPRSENCDRPESRLTGLISPYVTSPPAALTRSRP